MWIEMTLVPPAGQCVLPHHKNWSRIAQGTWQRASSVGLASKFHKSKSDWASMRCGWKKSTTHGGLMMDQNWLWLARTETHDLWGWSRTRVSAALSPAGCSVDGLAPWIRLGLVCLIKLGTGKSEAWSTPWDLHSFCGGDGCIVLGQRQSAFGDCCCHERVYSVWNNAWMGFIGQSTSKWMPDPRFSSKTLHYSEMINVMHFGWQ